MKLFSFKTRATLSALLLISFCLQAQDIKKNGWQYASLTQGGVVGGSSEITYTAQTIHGLRQKTWFMGVGIGIDNYGMPGFPLVAHVQKAFTQSRFQPFVYGQAGVQLPWKKGKWAEKIWPAQNDMDAYDLKNGFMGELGAGYLFGLGKKGKHAISVSTGYSYKFNAATYKLIAWPSHFSSLPPAGYNEFMTQEHSFHYRRIVVKLGFLF